MAQALGAGERGRERQRDGSGGYFAFPGLVGVSRNLDSCAAMGRSPNLLCEGWVWPVQEEDSLGALKLSGWARGGFGGWRS